MSKEVFISYSRKDQTWVNNFTKKLQANHISIWIDQKNIDASTYWQIEIVKAIRNCNIVILLATKASFSSFHVIREVSLAFDERKKIFPIFLEKVLIPDELRYQLTGIHYFQLYGGASKKKLHTLITSLKKIIASQTDASKSPSEEKSKAEIKLPEKASFFIRFVDYFKYKFLWFFKKTIDPLVSLIPWLSSRRKLRENYKILLDQREKQLKLELEDIRKKDQEKIKTLESRLKALKEERIQKTNEEDLLNKEKSIIKKELTSNNKKLETIKSLEAKYSVLQQKYEKLQKTKEQLAKQENEIKRKLSHILEKDSEQEKFLILQLEVIKNKRDNLEKNLKDFKATLKRAKNLLIKFHTQFEDLECKQALTSLETGNAAMAEYILKKMVTKQPLLAAKINYQLGLLAENRVDFEVAQHAYEKTIQLEPENPSYLDLEDHIGRLKGLPPLSDRTKNNNELNDDKLKDQIKSLEEKPENSLKENNKRYGLSKEVKSLEQLKIASRKEDSEAQFNLGVIYEEGKEVDQNLIIAHNWYRKASEKGHGKAQNNFGVMYEEGKVVNRDLQIAKRWYQFPAEQGYVLAQLNLGAICLNFSNIYTKERKKHYKGAIKWYSKAAEKSNAEALLRLGSIYQDRKGGLKNYKKAFQYYHKAIDQENLGAYNNLGTMYLLGQGVARDYKKALKLYHKAAWQNLAVAQNNIGEMYYYGHGVPEDYKKAVEWYSKAAEQNQAHGLYNLSLMYWNGEGITQNFEESFKLLNRAAEENLTLAQFSLGCMVCLINDEKNYINGLKWLIIAIKNGSNKSRAFKKKIEKKMLPDHIAEAESLAKEWIIKNQKQRIDYYRYDYIFEWLFWLKLKTV